MKKYLLLVPVLLLALPVSAAQFIQKKDSNYSLPQSEVLREDLYVGAQIANIDGTIEGDAYAAGNEIRIKGSVSENLTAGGRLISISGSVGHNVHVAGQTIEIGGGVHGDVISAGDSMTVRQGSVVDGDVFFFGNELHIDGEVKGTVHFFGSALTLNGAKVGSIQMHGNMLTLIGSSVAGDVVYKASKELSKDEASSIGGKVERREMPMKSEERKHLFAGFNIAFFLMGLVIVMLAVWLFGSQAQGFIADAVARPGRTGLIGALSLIGIPIVSVILMITVIGMPVGLLALLTYGVLIILAKVLATILIGAVLAKWIRKEYIVDYKWAFAGIIAITILNFIPFIGWIPGTIAFLCMFGVLILALEKLFHRN